MFVLRLHEGEEPLPVDARLLREGVLRIGRDPAADWVMTDPDCGISRWHCEFSASAGELAIEVTGANGVFDEISGDRLPDRQRIVLSLPTTLCFGPYRLVADVAPQAQAADGDDGMTFILSPPLGTSIEVPNDYDDAPAYSSPVPNGSLLDAFCDGAGLDVSAFALENPDQIMRRAGAVYRQMVLGVGDLMAERDAVRRRYSIARTTIGGANNNPFKWAPSQRLALDLLLAGDHGFMNGPTALKASFKDIKKHLIATFAGLQHSLRAAVDRFNPTNVENETAAKATLLKPRAMLNWEAAVRRHAELARQLEGEEGALNDVFVKAYDAAASSLETGSHD